jgi:hypothetical protein
MVDWLCNELAMSSLPGDWQKAETWKDAAYQATAQPAPSAVKQGEEE